MCDRVRQRWKPPLYAGLTSAAIQALHPDRRSIAKGCKATVRRREGLGPGGAARVASPSRPRDVFLYFIHEGKVRAPAGAMELIARVE